jgi:hypothetical protein
MNKNWVNGLGLDTWQFYVGMSAEENGTGRCTSILHFSLSQCETISKFITELKSKTQKWKPETNRTEPVGERLLDHYIHMLSFVAARLGFMVGRNAQWSNSRGTLTLMRRCLPLHSPFPSRKHLQVAAPISNSLVPRNERVQFGLSQSPGIFKMRSLNRMSITKSKMSHSC